MPNIQIINPIEYKGWDNLVLSHPNHSFFHSSAWAKVLVESYGYEPLYFTLLDKNRLIALMPLMEIRSFLTGRRGVSLPFSDYCEPMISNVDEFQNIFDNIINHGKEQRWKYLELRILNSHIPNSMPSTVFYRHILNLTEKEALLFSNFRKGTKSSIKKAARDGVQVNFCEAIESIDEFYRLICMTRKKHGLPPAPYHFFKSIYRHIISEKLGLLILASYKGENIAGGVFFHFGDSAIYKYGASDEKYLHLSPNNLIVWEAIKWYSQKNYKELCFGRTEPENSGLRIFKTGWGTKETSINYYKYDLKKDIFLESKNIGKLSNRIISKLPIFLLKFAGGLLYKHMG